MDRFTVAIKLEVSQSGTAGTTPFTNTTIEYFDMTREGISVIEHTLIKALKDLRDFGDKMLEDKKTEIKAA